jgi:glycosyltransferase involved in cell wall biosynthesis
MNRISIIVPIYNQTVNLIRRCLLSAIAQFGVDKEIIIIDDGSTDGCVEKAFDNTMFYKYMLGEDFRIIKKENGGVGSAFNRGIKESRYDYISVLSSDDYFYPEKSYLQSFAMEQSGCKFSYSGFKEISLYEGEITSVKICPSIYKYGIIDKNVSYRELLKKFPISMINGTSLLLHKDVFDKVGLFRTDLKYTQDYEMWLRIAKEFDLFSCNDIFTIKYLHENQMKYMDTEDDFLKHIEKETEILKGLYETDIKRLCL